MVINRPKRPIEILRAFTPLEMPSLLVGKVKFLTGFIDCFVLPAFIFFMCYDPNFFHGFLVTNDEGLHLAVINGILRGKILYRDLYILFAPLSEYLPAVLMEIFGPSLKIFRAFYHFGTIFGLIFAYFLARKIIRTRFFLYLLTWLLLVTKVNPFWSSRWGGIRTGLGFLSLILMIVYIRRKRGYWLCLSGVTTGVSFLVSQEIGICVLFASFVSLAGLNFLDSSLRIGNYLKKLLIYNIGFIIVVLPFLIYALYVKALLPYLKTCFIDVPFKLHSYFDFGYSFLSLPNSLSFAAWFNFLTSRTFYFYGAIFVYLLGGIYLIVKVIQKKLVLNDLYILILLSFGAPLLKFATREIYGMQFNAAAPPIVIIGSFLMEKMFLKTKVIFKKAKLRSIFKLEFVSLLIILVLSFFYINMATIPFKHFTNILKTYRWGEVVKFIGQEMLTTPEQIYAEKTGRWARLDCERAKGILVPQEQAEVLTAVVNYIRKNTQFDEPIFVFSHSGQYHFLTDRQDATRFSSPIYAAIDPEYQHEVIRDIEESNLRYIIYVADAYVFTDFKKIPNEIRLNQVFNYIKGNYFIEARFGETYILKRTKRR